ncbi:MAG: sugar ABC transporter permease [bacterium]|nr:sugar ABC transporter permease [bacterium]
MNNRSDRILAIAMLTPSIILLAIFVYVFIFQTIQTSTTDWGENPSQPALAENIVITYNNPLLKNYERLMTNTAPEYYFRNSLVNAFFFTIFFIAGCLAVGLLLALLLDQKIVGEALFRTIFLFPMSLSFIVTGTIWAWLLRPDSGLNVLPQQLLGLAPIQERWINNKTVALGFNWHEVPSLITLLGVGILVFLIFRYLANEEDRLGRISSWLSQFAFVTVGGGFVAGLIFGNHPSLWLGAALIGIAVVVLRVAINDEDFGKEAYSPRSWRPVMWLGAGIGIILIARFLGILDIFWPPLMQPDLENRIAPKGYNAALTGVLIAAVWQMGGYTMAMFLAGLRGIPEELREAARVDGCTELRVYYSIVFPMLRPIMLSAVIILGHISLKIFDLVYAMAGADNAATIMPGILVFDYMYDSKRFGSASAIAVIMLFFVALVIVPYLWSSLRKENN